MENVGLHLLVDSRIAEIPRINEAIERFCSKAGASQDSPDFMLCTEELVTNVMLHGFGGEAGHKIEIRAVVDGAAIYVTIIDDAAAFDPTISNMPDLDADVEQRTIGGLGRHLVSTLMERFCYRRDEGRNYTSFGRVMAQQRK